MLCQLVTPGRERERVARAQNLECLWRAPATGQRASACTLGSMLGRVGSLAYRVVRYLGSGFYCSLIVGFLMLALLGRPVLVL
jgi:hypothetical protein